MRSNRTACDALPLPITYTAPMPCIIGSLVSCVSLSLSLLYFVWVSSAALTYTD